MGQSNLTWPNLEQVAHGDASWSETGASPLEPLRMLSQSSSKFWTSTILSILSRSILVSVDLASIDFGIPPLPNVFTALW